MVYQDDFSRLLWKIFRTMFEFLPIEKSIGYRTHDLLLNPNSHIPRLLLTQQCRHACGSGLPDGFFSDQKSQFGSLLEDLGMENVVIPIFWSFGTLYDH
jgi:hypothetical protein